MEKKRRQKPPKTFFLIAILVSILVLTGIIEAAFVIFKDKARESSFGDITKNPGAWAREIELLGPKRAYEEFKAYYKDKEAAHNSLHQFAGLMYKKVGLEGLAACDSDLAFGCYHGFFTAAIAAEGIEAVSKLDSVCVGEFGPQNPGCQHGIGHGLIEYLGPKKLSEALDLCAKLTTWQGKIFGCKSGVFMEYNMPFLIEGDFVYPSLRHFEVDKPYFPCDSIDAESQSSCYFELAQYLIAIYKKDYQKLGSVCLGVGDSILRKYCFLGLGYYAPQAFSHDGEKIINACKLMPGYSFQAQCQMAAALSSVSEGETGKALLLCVGLRGEDVALCKSQDYFRQKGVI